MPVAMEHISERVSSACVEASQVLCNLLIPRFRCLKLQGQVSWSDYKKELELVSSDAANLVDSSTYFEQIAALARQRLSQEGFHVTDLSVDTSIYSKRQIHYSARLQKMHHFWKMISGVAVTAVSLGFISALPLLFSKTVDVHRD